MACHSDQALALSDDASDDEVSVLAKMQYKSNDVVLHTDASLLPRNKKTWSSWNYLLDSTQQDSATLTYQMNILQGISSKEDFCVTLNATQRIDPEKILGQYSYSHPVFTMDAIEAQAQWPLINGVNKTWFCGAYWANGFHEDGCSSGVRVAKALGADW
jgi:predicted NAD/FAD-binding protein